MAEIYFEGAFGQGHPRRDDGAGSLDYSALELSLGVRRPFPWKGAVFGEVAYNRLSSGPEDLGSYRNLVLFRGGYRQSFLKYFYAAAGVGTGVNDSHLNFGDGRTPLPSETGMPLVLSGQLGGQYCFGRHPCAELFVSPAYERSIAGGPDYSDRRLLFGVGFAFDLSRTAPYDEYRAAVEERERLRGEVAELEARPLAPATEPEVAQACLEPEPRECPECPPPPPPFDVPAILAENPLRLPYIFTNESAQLARREEREHRVRVGLSEPWLDRVAVYLKSHPNIGVRIKGYANDTGPEDQNITLSNDRAQAVARYLRRHGVPERQIVDVRGFGSSTPLIESNPADTMNRAVRFEEVPLP